MTSTEMLGVAEILGISPKELAYLLGISERTILRGVQDGGVLDILIQDLKEGLEDPNQFLSIRAAAIMSARSGGLKTYLKGMRGSYVVLDRLILKDPTIVR